MEQLYAMKTLHLGGILPPMMEAINFSTALSPRSLNMSYGIEIYQHNIKTIYLKYEPVYHEQVSRLHFSFLYDQLKSQVSRIHSRYLFELLTSQSPSHTILLSIAIGLVFFILRTLYVRHFHLERIPGPFWAAYTRLWLSKTIASGDSAELLVDINKKYGSLARIGPNNLVTDDPKVVRSICAARSHYVRGPWFDSIKIDPHVPNIVSERDTGKHNHLRHQMRAGYTGKEIEGTESVIDARITDFMDRIETKWLSSAGTIAFDIGQRIQFLALDIITHLCFGKPLGFLEKDRDFCNFIWTIENQLPIVQHFSVFLEFNTILERVTRIPFMKNLLLPRNTDKTGIGMIMGLSKEVVAERFQPDAQPKKDMLGSFIKHGLTASEVESEISISLVAGSDTTATSMRATLLAIISNPVTYAKLTAEIEENIKNGNISSPITDAEARKLPYLQACILEGLRRFPPITQLREREVPPEGDVINGYKVPGGTFVGINAWGLQLNPVFGEDPEVFRPERWLNVDDAKLAEMMKVWDLIFGYGNTKCLGQGIAFLILNKIFVELLRRFDISVVNPHRPWNSSCYGIFFQKDFFVRVSKREARA